ncbi:ABC transporter permease [Paenibacillus thermotolerans]|uniref:ABC transporter permease n=1 Tax=Paenibacillus thermotolerans TaxID=3027807 RepID=UPI00236761F7|nr:MULTISPECIES: ABC transporter permease subunit [unclassified Paenibacillus]
MRLKRRFNKDDLELTFLAVPTVLWYLAFCYLPLFGIIIAFKQFRPLPGAGFLGSLLQSKFVGLDNFKFLFATPDAWIMFRNTILYNIVFIVLGTFVTVVLALMISQLRSKKMRKICQTSMFLPHFLSWVVVSYFVFAFLSTENGLVSKLLEMTGRDPVQWYMTPEYWPYILVFVYLWKAVGYGMVIYLAGISGIDESLYEAAIMDGSTKWQQVKYITLPMLQPIIIILFILSVGRIFSSDFGLFYQVPRNSGPLVDVTQTIDVYVYKALTGLNNIGFASAAGLLQSVLGLITILIANSIVKKINSENSLF